mmetsp:Transcript_15/g.25  ORF Transcript_15/g.25 Transcript_15/m.25 type:complete len:349 (+) Transcript_15:480-1526(+)
MPWSVILAQLARSSERSAPSVPMLSRPKSMMLSLQERLSARRGAKPSNWLPSMQSHHCRLSVRSAGSAARKATPPEVTSRSRVSCSAVSVGRSRRLSTMPLVSSRFHASVSRASGVPCCARDATARLSMALRRERSRSVSAGSAATAATPALPTWQHAARLSVSRAVSGAREVRPRSDTRSQRSRTRWRRRGRPPASAASMASLSREAPARSRLVRWRREGSTRRAAWGGEPSPRRPQARRLRQRRLGNCARLRPPALDGARCVTASRCAARQAAQTRRTAAAVDRLSAADDDVDLPAEARATGRPSTSSSSSQLNTSPRMSPGRVPQHAAPSPPSAAGAATGGFILC